MDCTDCGSYLPVGASFCLNCGRRVAQGGTPEPESGREKEPRVRDGGIGQNIVGWAVAAVIGVIILWVLLLAVFAYSVSVHLWARNRIDYLEKAVYGEVGTPVGEGTGMADRLVDIGDRLAALEGREIQPALSLSDQAALQDAKVALRLLCQHLDDHTRLGATPVYAKLREEGRCKTILEEAGQ